MKELWKVFRDSKTGEEKWTAGKCGPVKWEN
jgi:hypothetical protein